MTTQPATHCGRFARLLRSAVGRHLGTGLAALLALALTAAPAAAQTGPGGVGENDGSSSLVLWLDASDLNLTDGEEVQSWSDASGNANSAENQTAAEAPSYNANGLNGRPVISFDGSDDFLTLSNNITTTDATTFIVTNKPGGADQSTGYLTLLSTEKHVLVGEASENEDGSNVPDGDPDQNEWGGYFTPETRTHGSNQQIGSDWQLLTHVVRGTDAGGYESDDAFTNGGSRVSFTDAGTEGSEFGDQSRSLIGGNAGSGGTTVQNWPGNIAEVIHYGTDLGAAERTVVNSYLANKYDLTTGNPESKGYSYTSGFFGDFTGIGQASGDTRTSARSSALQLANPQGLSDGDFLFFGHDGEDLSSFDAVGIPSYVDGRVDRTWRVDETNGDVGSLTVQVDADGLPSTASGTDYYVLVDGDGDFTTTGDQSRARLTLDSGTTYSASGVDPSHGDYLTVAVGARPETPQNLTAESDLNQRVTLNWNAVTVDRTGSPTTLTGDTYRVYRNTDDNFSGATEVATSSNTSATVTGLTNGTRYHFWVTAVDDVGESDPQANGTTATPALKVRFASAETDGGEANGGADGFTVELSDTHDQDVTFELAASASARSVESVTVQDGGTGFSVGEVIKGTNPNGEDLELEVTATSGGAVTDVDITNGGSGFTGPPTDFNVPPGGGNGTGADFDVTLQSAGSDFTLTGTTFTVPANQEGITLGAGTLSFTNDQIPENTEAVGLALSSPSTSGATATLGGQTSHTVTIQDDDFDRNVFLVDTDGSDTDGTTQAAEETTVTYTVETDAVDNVNPTRVEYRIDLDAAATTADSLDFRLLNGSVTIPSGDNSATFDLPIRDDNAFEDDENVVVRLTSVTNANLDASASGRFTSLTHTIANGADQEPQVSFAASGSSVSEGGNPSIQVDLSVASGEDVEATVAATGGTASGGGDDYTLASTNVVVPAGDTVATIAGSKLPVIDDAVDESDETVELTLQGVSSGSASVNGGSNTHVLTITDNDPAPAVAFRNATSSALEPAGTAEIAVDLSEASERDVTVNYDVSGIALGGGADYTDEDGGSVTIGAGNTSATIDLSLADDTEVEGDETVTFSLTAEGITNGQVGGTATHTFTLRDNDVGATGPGGVGASETVVFWLDASDLSSLSGGNDVSTWRDASGSGNDAEAVNPPTLREDEVNGRPAVDFDGSDDYLRMEENIATTDATTFIVTNKASTNEGSGSYLTLLRTQNHVIVGEAKENEDGSSGRSTDGRNDVNEWGGFYTPPTRTHGADQDGNADFAKIGPDYKLLTHVVRGNASGYDSDEAYTNGGYEATLPNEGTFANQSSTTIGANGDKQYWPGNIAEAVHFETDLNETRRTIVENYLAAKYDLGLATGNGAKDVYAGDQASNGDYDRGVFGIGREGDTDLHSASETAGLRFEQNAGLDDGDYLLAGHKTPNNSVNTSDLDGVSGLEARMERTWYVSRTEASTSDLTVDVTVDLAAADLAGPAGSSGNYVLLSRPAGGDSWTAQKTASNVSENEITFTGVSLADGDEVTLGTTSTSDSPLDTGNLVITGTAGADGDDQGWRYLGLPAQNATAGDLERIDGSTFIDFSVEWMAYTNPGGDLATTDGKGWDPVENAGESLANGRGFILWLYDNATYPLDPSLTLRLGGGTAPGNTDVTVGGNSALSQSDVDFLLANPYAVPFDLGELNGSGFDTMVQIWQPDATEGGNDPAGTDDANTGSFVMRSQSGNDALASWQGFILSRTASGSGDTQVTFRASGRADGADPSFVGTRAQEEDGESRKTRHRIPLRLVVENDQGRTLALDRAAAVLFHENATRGRDRFDAPKYEPMASPFATVAPVAPDGQTLHAQESRPLPNGQTASVPVDVRSEGVNGTFRLFIPSGGEASAETPSIPEGWTVRLVDTKGTADPSDDVQTPLVPGGPAYTFSVDSGEAQARTKAEGKQDAAGRAAARAASDTTAAPPPAPSLQRMERSAPDTTRTRSAASADAASDNAASGPRFRLVVQPSGALPVELARLKAQRSDQQAVLTWKTASETGNAGFEVQHQRLPAGDTTAAPAASEWSDLGFVDGAGTTTQPQSYRFETDELDYGRHAFRLRQVDADGTASTTDPVEVQVRLQSAYSVEAPYPNPARQQATLPVTVREKQDVTVEVYDLLGRRVHTVRDRSMQAQQTRRIALPVGRLSSGSYFVRVQGEGFSVTRRLTVVR